MPPKDITIILLLYNSPVEILKNLRNYKKFPILILDQSNDHSTKKIVQKILPNILYYKVTKENLGFAKAINFLSKKVKTKYFLCTQPDVRNDLKSIINLKKIFDKKKDCIISVPKIDTFDNNLNKKSKEKIVSIKTMIGAIFLADKKLFYKINMFDENFFFYWEDIDLSKRISQSKFKIYLNKQSTAKHLGGKSSTQSFKNSLIKVSNFKFGEYLFQYKNSELRIVKIIRDPILKTLLFLFYLISFQFKKMNTTIFELLGILKFFIYIIFNFKLK